MEEDEAFARGFLRGVLPAAGFHHRDHLRLAWWLVRQDGEDGAFTQIRAGIRAWAVSVGNGTGFNETLTRFWVRMVAQAVQQHPDLTSFTEFLAACPDLLDRNLPLRYWSRTALWSDLARVEWVEPDLCRLPDV